MPKDSAHLTQARREEIISACAKLYETMSFKEITIKEIAAFTSFTRTSIYNYFQTKEEIFLALLQREYEAWTADLNSLHPSGSGPHRLELAEQISRTLERRERLLKLLSMNLNDMEANSGMEHLVEFKRAYGASVQAIQDCLRRFCPEMEAKERREFTFSFLPLIYGIYPYAAVTEKQRDAMEQAQIDFQYLSIYEITLIGAQKLLGVL
ncbi:MAG: TetR family transcriptional regulator [Oscillospiraceae bacterium]|nr:TetR family transcriptional regulator [Oscillospiraceae bacterium]